MAAQFTYTNHPGHRQTTEWEDVHRALGNLPPDPDPPEPKPDRPFDLPLDAVLAAPTASAGDQLADGAEAEGDDDDAAVRELRAKRLAELRRAAEIARGARHFGSLRHLPASDYTREVNQAGDGVWVVVALLAPAEKASARLVDVLRGAARRYASVKFVSMVGAECIPGYPAANCPTILVYRSDDLLAQLIGPRSVGLIRSADAEEADGAPAPPAWPDADADERSVLRVLGRVGVPLGPVASVSSRSDSAGPVRR